ncbi:MAG: hypothetical protein HY047_13890, partial [Acidobacteria bacterium]|nr:hypothetical protein [Acidobacteriota bacterium]
VAWAVGLLGGPAMGGFLFERIGFSRLTLMWAPALLIVTWWLARVEFARGREGQVGQVGQEGREGQVGQVGQEGQEGREGREGLVEKTGWMEKS